MKSLELFDVKSYLEDRGIPFATSGENISPGWIGIDCPNCSDVKNHFGINLRNKLYSCWRCGIRGNSYTFVRIIEKTNNPELIQEILRKYISGESYLPDIEIPSELLLPGDFLSLEELNKEALSSDNMAWNQDKWSAVHALGFLQMRGYDPYEASKQYHLMWSGITSAFKFRLILPVFMGGKMVNFVGRAVCGQEPPYKNCPNARAPIPINDTLYGYDEIVGLNQTIVLCEGTFDKWRLGTGSLATFGLVLTSAQANLLYQKKPKKIVFLYDSDVAEDPQKLEVADKSAAKIWFCPTETFILDKGDPDNLTFNEAYELMRKFNA